MADLHVLIVEDSADDAELIAIELRRAGYHADYTRVASGEDMLASMNSASYDLILSDYRMPDFSGLDALRLWKESGSLQPFMIVSGTIGEEAAVEIMKAGASDYILKDHIARLGPAVDRALKEVEEVQRRIKAEEALRQSELQFRTLVSSLPHAVYRCRMDEHWTMQYLSGAIENIVGYSPDEIINNRRLSYESLILPEDREQVRIAVERAVGKREAYVLKYRVLHRDGRIRWVREKGAGIWDEHGQLAHLDGVIEDITQRKKTEEALERREEWFRAIFNESPITINVFDAKGDLALANRACLDMFGVNSESDLLGFNLFSDPNTADWVKELVKKGEVVRYEAAFDFSKVRQDELYLTEKQGIMWLDAVLSPLRYGNPEELQGYIVQMQDITSRKNAEEELLNKNELLKKTIESQMDAVLVLDSSRVGRIVDVNLASTKIFGYDREEMIGMPIASLHISDESNQNFLQLLGRSIQSVGFLQLDNYPGKRKDGSTFPAELTVAPLVDDLDRTFGYVSVVRDVTEREEADRVLRESQELYRSTIESTGDGILVVGVNGQVMHMNSRFLEIWRIPDSVLTSGRAEALFSRMALTLKSGEDAVFRAQSLLSSPKTASGTYDLGNGVVIECYSAPILRNGTITARVFSFRDITRIKNAEASARLYLDLMGHDIRNRLQAVTLSVGIGRMFDTVGNMAEVFSGIESAAESCAAIVSKVKQTENLEHAPLAPRSLTAAVRACIDRLRSGNERVLIDASLNSSAFQITADSYLDDLLMNLFENAIVHNTHDEKRVWIRLNQDDGGYVLSVSDNGLGMSDERKEALFDPQRRYGGVGLHIAHQIADKYGGHISVRDRILGDPSEGTEFQLWLPCRGHEVEAE